MFLKSMTTALTLLALLVLPMAAGATVTHYTPPSTNAVTNPQVGAIRESTVLIHGSMEASLGDEIFERDDVNYCSGAVLGHTGIGNTLLVIATARHCTTEIEEESLFGTVTVDAKPDSVLFADGDKGRVVDTLVSPKYDLALLYVVASHDHAVATPTGDLTLGESLYVFGLPNGVPWTLSGAMSAQGKRTILDNTGLPLSDDAKDVFQAFRNKNNYQLACYGCGPGDSGGGVWDREGRYVGMLVIEENYNAFEMVPESEVVQFVKSHDPTEVPDHSLLNEGLGTPLRNEADVAALTSAKDAKTSEILYLYTFIMKGL